MGISSIFVSTGAINHFAGGDLLVTGSKSTAGIFATYLPEHMTLWRGFLDEVSGQGIPTSSPACKREQKNSARDRTKTRLCHCRSGVLLSAWDLSPVGCSGIYSPGIRDWDAAALSLGYHGQEEQPSTSRDRAPRDRHPCYHPWGVARHELRICNQPIP